MAHDNKLIIYLKLMCTNLNYSVLGTSTASIFFFFQMVILSMHL